ncbi:hypothetical protein sce7125 [Sorangium cellulosum So ce56]|uniref:Uncharacterized protein n=1 Tax=Sorangium cellulosum (strain So ce56) TaxID=448385 RepID=A9ERG9_SORC5|nr:hypothetical protein [Sorangium cellulosum]CAN97294.1 hypothetical protein sce7125 [Sorangium cellulosum So ce56]
MLIKSLIIDDKRGFIFTIDRQREPVYQLESKHWAHADHRWSESEIPPEIRAKTDELRQNGRPGTFVRSLAGESGVYLIYEKNIKPLPELADEEAVFAPVKQQGSNRELSPYDIVLCAKGGTIIADNGDVYQTREGDYYVIKCSTWGRFVTNQAARPRDVETTKEVLLLLEDLNGKNFLSMTPDKSEALPSTMPKPAQAMSQINCYVLNLARFKR